LYIVIGGAGDAGMHLGRLLRSGGHEVAFIERDPEVAEEARDIDALMIEGDVCDPQSLVDAGVRNCDYYMGLVTEDSANLASCSLANYYGCQTIARIKSPSLLGDPYTQRYSRIGVDVALCPALIAASQVSRVLAFPSQLRGVRRKGIGTYHGVVESSSKSCANPLSEVALPQGAQIVSIFRGIEQILPSDSLILRPEDEICVFLDDKDKLEDVSESLGIPLRPYDEVRDVFIAGITDAGLTLAERLIESGMSVTVMALSEKDLKEAAESLPRASIIRSDPLGHDVLKREEIEHFDVLLAMGANMERNMLVSVLTKRFGVPTAIALIDRIDLKESIEQTLVDDVVVPNLLLVKTLLSLVEEGGPLRRRTLQTRDILTTEIEVKPKSRCVGKNVGKFSPANLGFLIAAVSKGESNIVPDEEYVLSEGDRLTILHRSQEYDTVKRWIMG
jgi:trk system potassium uptake protein TrkA